MACSTKHYRWRRDVRRVVQATLTRYPALSANTYIDHPWVGWDGVSVDFWDNRGCGWPADSDTLHRALSYLFHLPGKPHIRHTILEHTLWTSYGGKSYWRPNDHSGRERHLHVTYWR